jgi:hypothetical protein
MPPNNMFNGRKFIFSPSGNMPCPPAPPDPELPEDPRPVELALALALEPAPVPVRDAGAAAADAPDRAAAAVAGGGAVAVVCRCVVAVAGVANTPARGSCLAFITRPHTDRGQRTDSASAGWRSRAEPAHVHAKEGSDSQSEGQQHGSLHQENSLHPFQKHRVHCLRGKKNGMKQNAREDQHGRKR